MGVLLLPGCSKKKPEDLTKEELPLFLMETKKIELLFRKMKTRCLMHQVNIGSWFQEHSEDKVKCKLNKI